MIRVWVARDQHGVVLGFLMSKTGPRGMTRVMRNFRKRIGATVQGTIHYRLLGDLP